METALSTTRDILQDALDQISSPRSSSDTRTNAFQAIERCLAASLAENDDTEGIDNFLALQYTFECNVPLRLTCWLGSATPQLESLIQGSLDDNRADIDLLNSQISQALCLLQGISLSHPSSKVYLGRKYPQEVLIDLLLASRHIPSPITESDPNSCRKHGSTAPPLTSLVLDTLLCLLVDSSAALRVFEVVSGPQAVVRILKRAVTPREVRMKCLEFLYFYLLDETTVAAEASGTLDLISPPTAPASPTRAVKPSIAATPLRPPSSAYGSSTYAFSDTPSGRSSRSTSGSSTLSFSSTSSNASSSTAPSSLSSSPEKPSSMPKSPLRPRSPDKGSIYRPIKHTQTLETPPNSPPLDPARSQFRFPQQPLQPKAMMMLKKEVDFVPMSPKKAHVANALGKSPRHHPKSKSMSVVGSENERPVQAKSRLQSAGTVPDLSSYSISYEEERSFLRVPHPLQTDVDKKAKNKRTTEEKKRLLGTMLGNVDALVEGVRKAGIWGLG